jgi:NAD-dependent deacetylase
VQPAASLPLVARRAGAQVVEINPERTPLSEVADQRIAGMAAEVLPQLL